MSRITLAGISLPADLQWSDEFTGWRVGQDVKTSLTGAQIIQEAARQAGRPITLSSSRDGSAWVGVIDLAGVRALQELESIPRIVPMDLVLPAHNAGDRTFQVGWRRTDGAAFEASALRFAAPAYDTDLFSITLRLMTV